MPGTVTNRGKFLIWEYVLNRAQALPTNFFFALALNSAPPTVDTNTWGQLNEIAAGNNYTAGGIQRAANATNFENNTQDQTNDRAEILVLDLAWTASGGPIPANGNGARWLVMMDDNATPGNRQVFAFWDLVSDRTVSDGQTLTLQDPILRAA